MSTLFEIVMQSNEAKELIKKTIDEKLIEIQDQVTSLRENMKTEDHARAATRAFLIKKLSTEIYEILDEMNINRRKLLEMFEKPTDQ